MLRTGPGHVPPGPVWGAVGSGHGAHVAPVCAPAAGSDPAAVESPLDLDPGQGEQAAATERLHGLAAGRGDLPLALPGQNNNVSGSVPLSVF